ncbi:MAG: preprotein translocase subunit YajC [Clostridia bacterium]|nr:preprotein translocase subunit YajC [Clostridia bacterium]MDD4571405.1 preprotein translocase subunit YajC [Clostridia bacterium]
MDQQLFSILYIAVFILIFYFLLIRPQQKNRKKRQELLGSLNVNDRVYTAGGILGTITMVKEDSVWLKVADKVEIQVLKTGIGGLQSEENK